MKTRMRFIYLAFAATIFATGGLADRPSVRPTPRPRPLPGGQHLFASVAGGRITEFPRNGTQFAFAPGLSSPRGLAFDSAGNLFVATTSGCNPICNGSIVKITPDGVQTTLANLPGFLEGVVLDQLDNVFVIALNPPVQPVTIYKITPGGVPSVFATLPASKVLVSPLTAQGFSMWE